MKPTAFNNIPLSLTITSIIKLESNCSPTIPDQRLTTGHGTILTIIRVGKANASSAVDAHVMNPDQHVVLPHRDMPAGLAHHNTEHGQIWRVGPRGFEDHPDKDQAPHDLQQAWKAHQKVSNCSRQYLIQNSPAEILPPRQTLQGVQHVLVADNNLLGHLCPLASIARSMDTFARNIFVTFFFESNFSGRSNLVHDPLSSTLSHAIVLQSIECRLCCRRTYPLISSTDAGL